MAWRSTARTAARLTMPAPRRTSVIHGALISSIVLGCFISKRPSFARTLVSGAVHGLVARLPAGSDHRGDELAGGHRRPIARTRRAAAALRLFTGRRRRRARGRRGSHSLARGRRTAVVPALA